MGLCSYVQNALGQNQRKDKQHKVTVTSEILLSSKITYFFFVCVVIFFGLIIKEVQIYCREFI